MKSVYYDSAYIFKTLCAEDGYAEVQKHMGTVSELVCSLHGKAEVISVCHRKFREGYATHPQLLGFLAQLRMDITQGVIRWLPITEEIVARVENVYASAPANTFIRAADALHLASAAENGFDEIFSNDRHLLIAAPLFGLRGINIIPS
ncbi:MAG: type II toxin-antitoxin system VapC family toxin [Verrucomicrobiota bacterium]|nr:type II toxin-antitoxin system VapC family toxin [Verrucomicrobiota bacterium]